MKKTINRNLTITSWGFCMLTLFAIVLAGDVSAESFAVVVNKANDIEDVSFNDLVKYFSAKKRFWPNGKKVVILLPGAGSEDKKVLLEKVYKQSEKQLRKMWVGKVYKGQIAAPPKAKKTSSAMIKAVSAKKGGLGIVKATDVSDEVKVLKVDGKLPSDAGFPLQN